jgi:hypothetical protein
MDMDPKCLQEKIRRVWIEYRSKTLDTTIRIFRRNDFREVDIDGHWFAERDQEVERLQSHPPLEVRDIKRTFKLSFRIKGCLRQNV